MTLNLVPAYRGRDLTGHVFGFLTCIRRDGTKPKIGAMWLCRCACGKELHIGARHLTHENRSSCGCRRRGTPWPEGDEMLRKLWAEGLSSQAIADRIGTTKNAVIGRAGRIGLDARPSPIKRGGAPAPPPRAPRTTLAPLRSIPPVLYASRSVALEPAPDVDGDDRIDMRKLRLERLPPRTRPTSAACCWPLSSGRPWRFCDDPHVVAGKPYCALHVAIAYDRVAA